MFFFLEVALGGERKGRVVGGFSGVIFVFWGSFLVLFLFFFGGVLGGFSGVIGFLVLFGVIFGVSFVFFGGYSRVFLGYFF